MIQIQNGLRELGQEPIRMPLSFCEQKARKLIYIEWVRTVLIYGSMILTSIYATVKFEGRDVVAAADGNETHKLFSRTDAEYQEEIIDLSIGICGLIGLFFDCIVNRILQRGVYKRNVDYLRVWYSIQIVMFGLNILALLGNAFVLTQGIEFVMIAFCLLAFLAYRRIAMFMIKEFQDEITNFTTTIPNNTNPA